MVRQKGKESNQAKTSQITRKRYGNAKQKKQGKIIDSFWLWRRIILTIPSLNDNRSILTYPFTRILTKIQSQVENEILKKVIKRWGNLIRSDFGIRSRKQRFVWQWYRRAKISKSSIWKRHLWSRNKIWSPQWSQLRWWNGESWSSLHLG